MGEDRGNIRVHCQRNTRSYPGLGSWILDLFVAAPCLRCCTRVNVSSSQVLSVAACVQEGENKPYFFSCKYMSSFFTSYTVTPYNKGAVESRELLRLSPHSHASFCGETHTGRSARFSDSLGSTRRCVHSFRPLMSCSL